MASRFDISGVTDKLYDSLLQRRKAVEFEKELLFSMQKHRDELAYKYAALAASGSRGGDRGRGRSAASPATPRIDREAEARKMREQSTSYNAPAVKIPLPTISGPAKVVKDPREIALATTADMLGTN